MPCTFCGDPTGTSYRHQGMEFCNKRCFEGFEGGFHPQKILPEFLQHVGRVCTLPPSEHELRDMLAEYMVCRFGVAALGVGLLRFKVNKALEQWMQAQIDEKIAYQE